MAPQKYHFGNFEPCICESGNSDFSSLIRNIKKCPKIRFLAITLLLTVSNIFYISTKILRIFLIYETVSLHKRKKFGLF